MTQRRDPYDAAFDAVQTHYDHLADGLAKDRRIIRFLATLPWKTNSGSIEKVRYGPRDQAVKAGAHSTMCVADPHKGLWGGGGTWDLLAKLSPVVKRRGDGVYYIDDYTIIETIMTAKRAMEAEASGSRGARSKRARS